MIGVVIGGESHTGKLLRDRKEQKNNIFTVNIPSLAMKDKVVAFGASHGSAVDKIKQAGVKVGAHGNLPETIAYLECELIDTYAIPEGEGTLLYVGKIIHAHARSDVFYDNSYHFDSNRPELLTLHHLGGSSFVVPKTVGKD